MLADFTGKQVVITGAAGVFGHELTHAFAEAGAILCLSDIRRDALAALSAELRLPPERLMLHGTDLTDEESIHELTLRIATAWGAPDVVINNAGIYPFGSLLDIDADLWDRVQATNLRAPFLLMQAFAGQMIAREKPGCFVNVSSGSAELLRTNGVHYCVSKRGLEYLSQGFALELAGRGIRVNCVRPGFAPGSEVTEWPIGYVEAMSTQNPMGHLIRSGDLASAVMFLASPEASYVTGTCLAIDGGSSIPRRVARVT